VRSEHSPKLTNERPQRHIRVRSRGRPAVTDLCVISGGGAHAYRANSAPNYADTADPDADVGVA